MAEGRDSEISCRRFAQSVALVTGGGSDIGLAVAGRLLREGARVLCTDLETGAIQAGLARFGAFGDDVLIVRADLADETARAGLVARAVDRWGRIDVLVNNAAMQGTRTPVLDTDAGEIGRIFAVNVEAAFDLCRQAGRQMVARRRGAIVNVSSIQAQMPVPAHAAYVASKGALAALTRALAVELSSAGVRANSVVPGVIATGAYAKALGEDRGAAVGAIPTLFGRRGQPDEVAAAVAFLASEDASFITGAELVVDGGRSISRRADAFQDRYGRDISAEGS